MDNLTHTLCGVAVAECVGTFLPRERFTRLRGLMHFSSVVANNFPDLDLLYSNITSGKLSYLLHHRGHTHTLVLALPLALLILAVTKLFARARRGNLSRSDQVLLFLIAVVGVILHIAMDSANTYGTHPFWPFWSGWIYGDFLFIMEPLLWVSLLPLLIGNQFPRLIDWSALAAWVVAIALVWTTGYVPVLLSAAVTVIGISILWVERGKSQAFRAYLSTSLALFFIIGFAVSANWVKRDLVRQVQRLFPDETIDEMALSPLPANPFCWSVHVVSVNTEQWYLAKKGLYAAFPRLFPPGACPTIRQDGGVAELRPVNATVEGLRWLGEHRFPLVRLQELNANNCQAAAALKFARVPFLTPGKRVMGLGDLRFDFSGRANFTLVNFEVPAPACPRFVPGWLPPRHRLLRPGHDRAAGLTNRADRLGE